MVNKPLMNPYFWGGLRSGGVVDWLAMMMVYDFLKQWTTAVTIVMEIQRVHS